MKVTTYTRTVQVYCRGHDKVKGQRGCFLVLLYISCSRVMYFNATYLILRDDACLYIADICG